MIRRYKLYVIGKILLRHWFSSGLKRSIVAKPISLPLSFPPGTIPASMRQELSHYSQFPRINGAAHASNGWTNFLVRPYPGRE
jgi:hypothetical protein